MDPWMDAAHRGATALVERGHDLVQADGPIQAKGEARTPEVPAQLPGHGGGAAMPGEVQGKMENAFGVDLSAVRIHEGQQAPAMGALAYTQGVDIHFAPGQYDSSSQRGQELLGHELAHVVQQSQGRVNATKQAKGVALNDDSALEQEADEMGARAARGESVAGSASSHLDSNGADSEQASQNPALQYLSTPSPSAVLQRQVFPTGTGKFYSDLDPFQVFDTKQEALEFEEKMEPPPPISGGRSATLFTYTSTKSNNKMSTRGIPQGPHTAGHAAVETALFGSRGNIQLEALISEQVRSPSEWRDIVNEEFGQNMFTGQSEMSLRVMRAYRDYFGLYQELQRVLAGQSQEDPYDLIHELIQLDPYTVYKFTNPGGVTKKHLKGKGETRDLSDPRNIDPNAKFKNREKYRETLDDRILMTDFDYHPSDSEDSSSSGYSSEEYASEGGGSMDMDEDEAEDEEIPVDDELHFFDPDEVPSDGNCFFQSLVNLGAGASVQALRNLARQNGGQPNIGQNGVWASVQDVRAVANALGIRIRVLSLDLGYRPIQDSTYGNGGPVVKLAHIFGGHFVPLRES